LGRDLAIGLGTFGHISNLERLKVGKFSKETSILLDDLIKIGNRQNLIDYIHPSISMLDDILAYEIESESDLFNLSLGKSIIIDDHKIKKSSSKFIDKELIFLSYEGDIVSIGKLVGNLFKPKKVLL
jgi:Pseudouridine synthase